MSNNIGLTERVEEIRQMPPVEVADRATKAVLSGV
jgi:hypothetical protein